MNFIKEFKDFKEIDILTDDAIKYLDKEIIMSILYKYRNENIGNKLWKIINRFKVDKNGDVYNTPNEWFEDKEYTTFMEYFKRRISKIKMSEILSQTNNMMSFPCECNVESIGDFNDTSSIIRLKKPTNYVVDDLKRIGISDIDNLSFINMKLQKVYYHRIHSPVEGIIDNIIEVAPEDNFFGNNNLWLVKINTVQFGYVYIVLVGELAIQDFTFIVKSGDKISMFQEIGNFEWASQVIIIYDSKLFSDISIKTNNKYFVGDKIFTNTK